MPKSDTWPGGIGLEASGLDSAGSCDSVVSANSGFSDDSLEYLSAEEKACLMFLEETIESLDTEDDSGLSNDEPDQVYNSGHFGGKLDNPPAFVSKSKLSDLPKQASKYPIKENGDTTLTRNILVPTPIVVASTKPDIPPDMNFFSKPSNSKSKHDQKPPRVHFDDSVVTSPPTKPKDFSVRTPEGPLPRGPLSYEALVYLQRSASTKKTPLCPTVDHTIESDVHPHGTMENLNTRNLPRSNASHVESSRHKKSPPTVPPKPKKIPANMTVIRQDETLVTSDISYHIKHAKDPQMVRQEALRKLGLLKDQQPPLHKSHSSIDPMPERFSKVAAHGNPTRSPSFCYSHVPTEPRNKSLQSSASFHHSPRRDHMSHSAPPSGSRAVAQGHAAKLNGTRNGGTSRELEDIAETEPKRPSGTQPAPQKSSVEYSVMVVPGMGADRREALRKLGLLKP